MKNLKRLFGKDYWCSITAYGNKYITVYPTNTEGLVTESCVTSLKHNFLEDDKFPCVPTGVIITDSKNFKHMLFSAFITKVIFFTVPERFAKYYTSGLQINEQVTVMGNEELRVATYRIQLDLEDLYWNVIRYKSNNLIIEYEAING